MRWMRPYSFNRAKLQPMRFFYYLNRRGGQTKLYYYNTKQSIFNTWKRTRFRSPKYFTISFTLFDFSLPVLLALIYRPFLFISLCIIISIRDRYSIRVYSDIVCVMDGAAPCGLWHVHTLSSQCVPRVTSL